MQSLILMQYTQKMVLTMNFLPQVMQDLTAKHTYPMFLQITTTVLLMENLLASLGPKWVKTL